MCGVAGDVIRNAPQHDRGRGAGEEALSVSAEYASLKKKLIGNGRGVTKKRVRA